MSQYDLPAEMGSRLIQSKNQKSFSKIWSLMRKCMQKLTRMTS